MEGEVHFVVYNTGVKHIPLPAMLGRFFFHPSSGNFLWLVKQSCETHQPE
jgi:hypothetical protein